MQEVSNWILVARTLEPTVQSQTRALCGPLYISDTESYGCVYSMLGDSVGCSLRREAAPRVTQNNHVEPPTGCLPADGNQLGRGQAYSSRMAVYSDLNIEQKVTGRFSALPNPLDSRVVQIWPVVVNGHFRGNSQMCLHASIGRAVAQAVYVRLNLPWNRGKVGQMDLL